MIKRKLFKNDTDDYVIWFNDIQKTILVALLDKHEMLIQEYQTRFMEYIVVPSGRTILLRQEFVHEMPAL